MVVSCPITSFPKIFMKKRRLCLLSDDGGSLQVILATQKQLLQRLTQRDG